jgi:hypothetical protein
MERLESSPLCFLETQSGGGLKALHTLLRFRSRGSLFLAPQFAITRPATVGYPARPIDSRSMTLFQTSAF